MPNQDKPAPNSPFEIITPSKSKKVGSKGIIIAVSIVAFLILSVVAGVLLVKQQQNISEKASSVCAAGYTTKHGQECKKNCTNDSGTGWYYINATQGASCASGPSGEARHLCDYDECDLVAATATATATASPSATPNYLSDNTNCGTAGHVCSAGTTCLAGECAAGATATATASATPTPTGTPNSCNGTCGSNVNCGSGLFCSTDGYCRNALCPGSTTCNCSGSTPTPTITATVKPTSTSSAQTTPLPVPVTGTDWPTIAAGGVGIVVIIASILLAI